MALNTELIIWLIPLPPALAFFLIWLFANRNNKLSHRIAVGAALLSWAGAMYVFWQAVQEHHLGEHPFHSSVEWFKMGAQSFEIGVMIDPLSAMVLFFVGITVLTSDVQGPDTQELVLQRARLAKESGLAGVVASSQEVEMLRKEFGKDFVIVTPGIRPQGEGTGDQKRNSGEFRHFRV